MPIPPVVTQLIVDASGAKSGVADFEAAMARAKAASVDGGSATATSFETAQRRWTVALGATDPVIKAQIAMQDALAKQQLIGNRAVELGIATQAAAAAQLDNVRLKHEAGIQVLREQTGQLTAGERAMAAFGKATSGVQGQLIALSAGAGPAGVFLSALGPWGIAAAVGIGAGQQALTAMVGAAHDLAGKAEELRRFSEATGLTTDQVQALRLEASRFGLTGEEVQTAVQNFTGRFNELRVGQGELLAQLRRVNPALADQMAGATDAAQAMSMFGHALDGVDNVFQRNALMRAAVGRGGPSVAAFFQGLNVDALTRSAQEAGTGIDHEVIEKLAKLDVDIAKTSSHARDNIASIFAAPVLEGELRFVQSFERFTEIVRDFKISGDWRRFISDIGSDSFVRYATYFLSNAAAPGSGFVGMGIDMLLGRGDNRAARPAAPADRGALQPLTLAGINAAFAPQATQSQTPEYLAGKVREQIAILGDAATASERYRLALAELAIKLHAAGEAEDGAIAVRARAALSADRDLQVTQGLIGALGPFASVQLQVLAAEQKLNAEHAHGILITDKQRQGIVDLTAANAEWARANLAAAAGVFDVENATKAAGDELKSWIADKLIDPSNAQQMANAHDILAAKIQRTKQAAEDANPVLKAMNDLTFQRMVDGMDGATAAAAQLSRQLFGSDWQAHMNDAVVQMAAFNERLKEARGFANDFGQTLIQNLAQGKSLADSLAASVNNLGSQIASKAMSSAVNGLFGGGSGAGGGSDVSIIVNQVKAITSALSSAMSSITQSLGNVTSSIGQSAGAGDPTQGAATGGGGSFGIIGNLAAALGISALQGQAAKAKQAVADFTAAQDAWAGMAHEVKSFTDQLTGNAGGSFTSALDDAKTKAQQYADAAHKAGQGADQINAALRIFAEHLARDFISAFDVMTEALNQGLGTESPAVKAQLNVKQLGETLKAFIVDTQNVTQLTGAGGGAVAAATASAEKYALSLLQTPPALSDVATKLLTLRGTAAQLQGTLQDLGMSATDAAAAIASGVTNALDQLKSDFTANLTSKINAATGKGYLNDLNNLITESLGMLADAKNLGTDPRHVAQYFQAQAQSIVDSAGLVGSSFDDLVTVFPELNGVVGQSRTALAQLQGTFADFLASLQTGNLSALSPQDKLAAARSSYQSTLAAAQGGDQTAMGKLTQSASDFLTQAKDYFASSADYAAIFMQVNRDIGAVAAASKTTNQLLGSVAQSSGISVLHLADVAGNTDATANATDATANATDSAAQTLQVLQSLQDVTKSASVDISGSVAQLGAQSQTIASTQSSQYFGPMVNYLSQIAANTLLAGQPAAAPKSSFEWWNPFTWFAEGGKVTGGTPGRDSVMGLLTPGEIVMNERISRQFEPLLLAMNRGQLPHFADGGMVGMIGGAPSLPAPAIPTPAWPGGANDNRAHFEYLATEFRGALRDLARAGNADTRMLAERMERVEAAVYGGAKQVADTQRIVGSRQVRPGTTQ